MTKEDKKQAAADPKNLPTEESAGPNAKPAIQTKKQESKPKSKLTNIITKFSFATKGGISAHNPYKVNQDAYVTNPHIMGLRHCHFFSVCDGHGSNGREVSSLLKHRLPLLVETEL